MAVFVLVHSPLVGPLSVEPTAQALRKMGHDCHVPTAPDANGDVAPFRDWPQLLKDDLPPLKEAIIAGHSMGGLFAACLAAWTNAKAMVCLDADMPPHSGHTPAVAPEFHAFLKTLPVTDGRLPKWQHWWGDDALAAAPLAQAAKQAFTDQIPAFRLTWFDDAFDMPDWTKAERHFIQTSDWFNAEAERATEAGWKVQRLKGTHLHPALAPEDTAQALVNVTLG